MHLRKCRGGRESAERPFSLDGSMRRYRPWKRVGEDPLKNLQKLSGRIKVAHLKDLTDKMEDATWGTGILPVKAFVNELKRQHFNGLISIEYDDFKSDIQEIRNSLEFLQKCSK